MTRVILETHATVDVIWSERNSAMLSAELDIAVWLTWALLLPAAAAVVLQSCRVAMTPVLCTTPVPGQNTVIQWKSKWICVSSAH